ncbi:MAG: hypothetical protein Q4C41_00110 [Eggerthellaceae bacterium]|nr:hypothetical protein [Eggerthellaceae bacterium]
MADSMNRGGMPDGRGAISAPSASGAQPADAAATSGFEGARENAQALADQVRSKIAVQLEKHRAPSLLPKHKPFKRDRHKPVKVAFFRYCYYDPAFKFFVEQVLDAEYLPLPAPTKRTGELGALHSSDYVCTPFKHHLGDYIEALELGANVIVQFCGPCRLGYYGELHESILRDLGYEFDMLNFSVGAEEGALGWAKQCMKTVNPDLSVTNGLVKLAATADMAVKLDEARDFYLANAGFERERGAFERTWNALMDDMRAAKTDRDIGAAYRRAMEAMRAIPLDKPADPIRIGVVGEMFTAIDERSNLGLDAKLLALGVEVHRALNLTNRWIRYNEPNLRASAADYLTYDMGPTSTLTVAAAHRYAQEGFDGIIHAKSAGCTPEIDCVPVLQRVSADFQLPVLYLTYDSQTSDTGLDTRLEAFYDMLAMKKEKMRK